MTTQEFWDGEPRVLCSYIKKHEMELDEINYNSWLIGLYVHRAVGSVVSGLSNKEIEYFDRPLEDFLSNTKINQTKKKKLNKDQEHRKKVNYWAKIVSRGRVV